MRREAPLSVSAGPCHWDSGANDRHNGRKSVACHNRAADRLSDAFLSPIGPGGTVSFYQWVASAATQFVGTLAVRDWRRAEGFLPIVLMECKELKANWLD